MIPLLSVNVLRYKKKKKTITARLNVCYGIVVSLFLVIALRAVERRVEAITGVRMIFLKIYFFNAHEVKRVFENYP